MGYSTKKCVNNSCLIRAQLSLPKVGVNWTKSAGSKFADPNLGEYSKMFNSDPKVLPNHKSQMLTNVNVFII
jgi:hypothetical protein